LLLKPGVDISLLHRAVRRILPKIESHYPDFVITCTWGDTHNPGSLHYAHKAVDLRLRDFHGVDLDVGVLRALLGKDFDVVKEPSHIHIEYDPKQENK
jgi:hypothetical protein